MRHSEIAEIIGVGNMTVRLKAAWSNEEGAVFNRLDLSERHFLIASLQHLVALSCSTAPSDSMIESSVLGMCP